MSYTALEAEMDRAWETALRRGEISCCSVCGRLFIHQETEDEIPLCHSCDLKSLSYRKYKDNMGAVLAGKIEAAIDGLNNGTYDADRFIKFVKEQINLYNISKLLV